MNLNFYKLGLVHKRLILLLGAMMIAVSTYAQRQVTGQVTSYDGETLPGVNILEMGTANGSITDVEGNYSINISRDEAVLVFSYVGYVKEEIEVGNKAVIDVSLVPDLQTLQELVVIGYGTVKKSDLTGAVVSIKAEDMTAGANLTVEQMLQGRAPGVNIQSKSGEPGGAISVKIRGASSITAGNDPLYVVDGMPFNTGTQITGTGAGFVGSQNARNPLNSINPNDIASIEILKDASATAIYGSRGSNGVVLITTKSGQAGDLKINYSYSRSIQEVAKKYEILDAHQYQTILNELIDEGAVGTRVKDFQGDGINWPELIYRDGSIDEHNISASGGNRNTNYYLSLSAFSQEGILINSGLDRYSFKVNVNTKVEEKFNIGLNLNTAVLKDQFISNGVGVNENAGALYAAIYYDPTIPRAVDPFTGRYVTSQTQVIDNPLALANHETAKQTSFRIFGSLFAEYFFIPSLSAKVKIAGDIATARKDVWVGPQTLDGVGFGGIGTVLNRNNTYHLGELTMNFNKTFGDHSISAVSGVTYEEFNVNNFSGQGGGFLYPDLQTDALGSGADTLEYVGSGRSQSKLNAFLARVNYSFMNRYLLTASIRADGSSRFGPNNKIGYFPSAALGWKLHEEAFMADFSQLSELKLRGSYGVIGNQAIGNYLYITTFAPGPGAALGGQANGTIQPSRYPNPQLRWESAEQMDIGVDFGLFSDRLHGSFDYYKRTTKDLLLAVPQPTSTGFIVRTENLGQMENTGIELALSGFVLDEKDLKWEISGNFATLKNKVTDLGGVEPFFAGNMNFVNGATIVQEGSPLYTYWGYRVDGVWQTEDNYAATKTNAQPGDWKYRDVNGDSVITADDRVVLGDSFHDFTWGLTNTITFKGLSVSVYLDAAHGGKLLNQNRVNTFYPITFRNNRLAEPYLNRWTEDNPTNEYASFVRPNIGEGYQVNSRTVEDASYVRLQSIRLAYNIPVNKLGLDFIDSFNVFVTAQNLKTWTNYSGVDPAVNSFGNNNIPMDFNAYPFARTYTVGLNIGL